MSHDALGQPVPAAASPSAPIGDGLDGDGPDGAVGVESDHFLLQHAEQPPTCPAWAPALMELLQRHSSYRSPSALPLHLLLAELDGWLLLDRAKPWPEKGTRKQLQAEVQTTRVNLGPAVATALGSDLATYFDHLVALTAQDAPGREDRDRLAALGQRLRDQLASALLLRAAWQDLLRAAAEPHPQPESIYSALTTLRGQLTNAGHDADQRLATAAGILGGTTFALGQAFSTLGLTQPRPEFRRHSWFDLMWPVREELAARWLAYPARQGRCVVWLAYRGQLHTPMLTSSASVAFYPLRWVHDNGPALASQPKTAPIIEGASGQRGQNDMPAQTAHLAELDQYEDLDEITPSPDTPACLVRIDLGTHAVEQALTEGRQRADDIIAVAASDADVHAWKPLGWERLLVDEHRHWAHHYVPRDQLREQLDLEGVAPLRLQHALTEDASRLSDRLASHHFPPELREVRRSMDEARHGRPATAIVAYGRVLEFAAAAAGLGSYADLEDDLRFSWQYSQWNAELLNTLSYCLHDRYSRVNVDPQIAAAICTSTETGETYHLEAAWTYRHQLLRATSDDSRSRQLEELLNSINAADQHLDLLNAFGAEYDVLKLRRRRVRNALTHGNPAHPDVIASVAPHATYLAQASQSFMLTAYLTNTTVSSVVSTQTTQNRQVIDGLRNGHSMLSQWADQT